MSYNLCLFLSISFTPYSNLASVKREESPSLQGSTKNSGTYMSISSYTPSPMSCQGYNRTRWKCNQVYLIDASSFQMYVDTVLLNKIKMYFKTLQILLFLYIPNQLIIKSSLLLFEGPHTAKSWQSLFYSRM